MSSSTRAPAVAGSFYPAEPRALRRMLAELMAPPAGAEAIADPAGGSLRAVIAPHAGYIYSGHTAATAYRRVACARDRIRRVALLGPAHRVAFRGLALCSADRFTTPLGDIPVDGEAQETLRELPQVSVLDEAHAAEHSLEVHLPFLQSVLGSFSLVPIVVGEASPAAVAEIVERLWALPRTLVVVSSDLSHYLDYDTAVEVDRETSRAIEALRTDIRPVQACGCRPLNGLLHLVRKEGLAAHTLELCNSGDTAGPRDRVVGYGAWAVE